MATPAPPASERKRPSAMAWGALLATVVTGCSFFGLFLPTTDCGGELCWVTQLFTLGFTFAAWPLVFLVVSGVVALRNRHIADLERALSMGQTRDANDEPGPN